MSTKAKAGGAVVPPHAAVALATMVASIEAREAFMPGRDPYTYSSDVRSLCGDSSHRAAAYLRRLEAAGLIKRHKRRGSLRWTLTVEGTELSETARPGCFRCGTPVEPGLEKFAPTSYWEGMCRRCLLELHERHAQEDDERAERAREEIVRYESSAQRHRDHVAALRAPFAMLEAIPTLGDERGGD